MCSPATQGRSTILPQEDLLTRKLLLQRGRQGGGESPPLPRGKFAQRRCDVARCDESRASPSPSFEGGFSDGVDASRVHWNSGDVRHPQPPWKGGFSRELRGVRVKRGTYVGVRKTQPLTRPKQPAGLRSPPLRCAAQLHKDARPSSPERTYLQKKLLPQRGRQGGGESPPLPRGKFARRRILQARCDESRASPSRDSGRSS